MYQQEKIWMACSDKPICLLPKMANRHGLITGASGSGKTVTLKVMAEGFSNAGVPVFLADIKGDLAGMCQPGEDNPNMRERISRFGIDNWQYTAFPTRFWDVFGKKGHPVRTTISDMGPLLLAQLMNLTEVQSEVLQVIFKIADDKGLLLIDTKDLKAMVQYVGEHKDELVKDYGGLSPQSLAALQRNIVTLETSGGETFFAEPMLDIFDMIRTDSAGRGYINILDATELSQNKMLYSAFMLWLLSELYENMPEAGDLDKPRAVFFFDEAHLIFNDAPKVLTDKIEQVIKLIRSKAVGIYFISQNPADIPDPVLAQLSNKLQHALRAYTPKEQKAIKAVADSFRPNPAFKTAEAVTELATGEALVSFLDESGAPSIVERAFVLPPQSRMGTVTDAERAAVINNSDLFIKYSHTVDNRSAYEVLQEQNAMQANLQAAQKEQEAQAKQQEKYEKQLQKQRQSTADRIAGNVMSSAGRSIGKAAAKAVTGKSSGTVGNIAGTLAGNIGRELGKSITRGIFGSKL